VPTITPTLEELPFPPGNYHDADDEKSFFRFGADRRWSHHYDTSTLATGEFRIEGDLYLQTKNSHGCPVPMSFRYTFEDGRLTFELTEESRNDNECPQRSGLYDGKTYILAD
jgi:hypothetical protein